MHTRGWFALRSVVTLVVVAGLTVEAYVHLDLASGYDAVASSILSQGDLFRWEAAAALVAAGAVLARPRRYPALFALVVAGGGLAAGLLYGYVDVGALGPLPDMYEPFWYPEKALSAYAEGVAALAAATLLILIQLRGRAAGPGATTSPESTLTRDIP